MHGKVAVTNALQPTSGDTWNGDTWNGDTWT